MEFPPDDRALNLLREIEGLRQTAERLERAGLIVDRASLSPAHRRALFALQCHLADRPACAEPAYPRMGFAYPNDR